MNAIKNKRYVTRFFKNRLHTFYFFRHRLGILYLLPIYIAIKAAIKSSIVTKYLFTLYSKFVSRICEQVIFKKKNWDYLYILRILIQNLSKLYEMWITTSKLLLASMLNLSFNYKDFLKIKTNLLLVEIDKLYNEHNFMNRGIQFYLTQ
jgi:hypothetical protein